MHKLFMEYKSQRLDRPRLCSHLRAVQNGLKYEATQGYRIIGLQLQHSHTLGINDQRGFPAKHLPRPHRSRLAWE